MHQAGVIDVVDLSETVFLLRLERCGLVFQPGQYVRIGPDAVRMREYTVYTPPNADCLEVLVKVVEGGAVSGRLRKLDRGRRVFVDGPFGAFRIADAELGRRHLFIAAGTGIAPFHCYVQSYPGLDHTLIHGVRKSADCYHRAVYAPGRYTPCLTRDPGRGFPGRVTDWLRAHPVEAGVLCHLCGGTPMIWECHDILREQGIPEHRIRAEVYF